MQARPIRPMAGPVRVLYEAHAKPILAQRGLFYNLFYTRPMLVNSGRSRLMHHAGSGGWRARAAQCAVRAGEREGGGRGRGRGVRRDGAFDVGSDAPLLSKNTDLRRAALSGPTKKAGCCSCS